MATDPVPAKQRKPLLSIDGGGLAGPIPAESLILIEKQLDDLTGSSQPLCNRFDLIGGTSTGAILAPGWLSVCVRKSCAISMSNTVGKSGCSRVACVTRLRRSG